MLKQSAIELPPSIKHKRYRQEFRTRFCEGLLARRILLAEGATEAASMPAAARRLSEIDPETYSSFEALGLCIVDAGGDGNIADLGKLYGALGKAVYAVCDKQGAPSQAVIEAQVAKLFMHAESDIEKLVRGTRHRPRCNGSLTPSSCRLISSRSIPTRQQTRLTW